MHRAKLIIGTVLVVAAACAIYVYLQPKHQPPSSAPEQHLARQHTVERAAPTTSASQPSIIHRQGRLALPSRSLRSAAG
jgi:hypothetical protein